MQHGVEEVDEGVETEEEHVEDDGGVFGGDEPQGDGVEQGWVVLRRRGSWRTCADGGGGGRAGSEGVCVGSSRRCL